MFLAQLPRMPWLSVAIETAGLLASPDRCLFVGENAAERAEAKKAGKKVCSDPTFAKRVLTDMV